MSIKNTGELNRKIEIQEYVVTTNLNGFEDKAWTTIITAFAKVENTNGSKYFNAGSEDIKKNTKFTIRYNSTLATKATDPNYEKYLRVVYNSKNYIVHFINDVDEGHIWLEIVGEANGS